MNTLGSLRPADCVSPEALASSLPTALAPCWIAVWPLRATGGDARSACFDRRTETHRSAGAWTTHRHGGDSPPCDRATIDAAPCRPGIARSAAIPDAPG